MAHKKISAVTTLLSGTFKVLTLSFFLGFGLTSCSHSTDDSEEPVQVSEASGEDGATAETPPAEEAPITDTAEAPPPEESVVALDEGAPTPPPGAAEEPEFADAAGLPPPDAPPPELAEATSDTVKAELTDRPPEVAPPPPAPEAPAADTLADTFEAKSPEPLATSPEMDAGNSGNSVSSPGAARFITSRHEGKRQGKHTAKHRKAGRAGKGKAAAGAGNYVVVAGDTLGKISKKIYGTPKQWTSLAELNGLNPPYIIRPGDAVKFDTNNDKAKAFMSSYQASMKTIEVKPGDTLSKIAAQVYGNPNAWPTLHGLNKDQISDANRIEVGMKLSYVDSAEAKQATATAPPSAGKATVNAKKKGPAATQPAH